MLPTRLNLLPEDKKKKIKEIIFFQFIKDLLGLSLFLLCISSITIIGGVIVMQNYSDELSRKTIVFNAKYEEINKKTRQLNQTIEMADKIQKKYILWTPIIAEFTTAIPENIYLKSLNFNMETKKVSFSGTAPTRDDLLLLQKTINEHPLLGEAEIPLSSLTYKENIPFSITTSINK